MPGSWLYSPMGPFLIITDHIQLFCSPLHQSLHICQYHHNNLNHHSWCFHVYVQSFYCKLCFCIETIIANITDIQWFTINKFKVKVHHLILFGILIIFTICIITLWNFIITSSLILLTLFIVRSNLNASIKSKEKLSCPSPSLL